jgi:hypothetical protein
VARQQLGRVSARESGKLIGFVNVARDGCVHAFVLDTVAALSGSAGKPDASGSPSTSTTCARSSSIGVGSRRPAPG